MTTPTLEANVHEFLGQQRIAVAGVSRSNSQHPAGNLIYRRLKKTGHDVVPVNPNMQTFEGDRCYPDLQSIPGGVDGVVIVTRPETAERIVQECSNAGVRRVWMHQSLGKQGSSVSPAAVEYCRQHDISGRMRDTPQPRTEGHYRASARPSYCSGVTCSSQSTTLPSSFSCIAMCVIAVVGAAPCQCFSPGGNQTTSPGRISSTGPPQRCARPAPVVTINV